MCRRGTRELDLLLSRYLERDYDRARPDERAAFEKLLELPDPELCRLLGAREHGGDAALDRVARRIAGRRALD